MASIDIAMESTSQQILNKLNESSSSSSGYTPGMQTFTSNGTFTVPAGVYKINVTACGAVEAAAAPKVIAGCGKVVVAEEGQVIIPLISSMAEKVVMVQ